MRKSSAIVMGILLAGFGALFVAADAALGPLARDAEASRELTREFHNRGHLAPESRIRILRVVGASKRLAAEGRGLLVHLAPREAARGKRERLGWLATQVAAEALGLYPGQGLAWVEVVFEVGEARCPTLVRVGEDGRLLAPSPSPDAQVGACEPRARG